MPKSWSSLLGTIFDLGSGCHFWIHHMKCNAVWMRRIWRQFHLNSRLEKLYKQAFDSLFVYREKIYCYAIGMTPDFFKGEYLLDLSFRFRVWDITPSRGSKLWAIWWFLGVLVKSCVLLCFFGVASVCWLEVYFAHSYLRVECIVLGESLLEAYQRDNNSPTLVWHLENSPIYSCKSKYLAKTLFLELPWVVCITVVALQSQFQEGILQSPRPPFIELEGN